MGAGSMGGSYDGGGDEAVIGCALGVVKGAALGDPGVTVGTSGVGPSAVGNPGVTVGVGTSVWPSVGTRAITGVSVVN